MTKQEMRPIDANRLNADLKNIQEHTETDKTVMASSLSVFLDYAMEIVNAQPTITPQPKCYSEDVDGGCKYLVPDGDDEPIARCKRCPLCYVDKQRHQSPPNTPLTLEELREMRFEPAWVKGIGRSGWTIIGYSSVENYVCIYWPGERGADILSLDYYSDTWLAYRRKPEEGTA